MIQRVCLFICLVLVISLLPLKVFAFDEPFYMINDIQFYNPLVSACGGTSDSESSTSSVDVASSDNLKQFIEYFTGKGFSLAAAAGIAGNIRAESNFNPKIIQGGGTADDSYNPVNGTKGFGLAQWTSIGRQQNLYNFAKQQHKNVTDLSLQLDFMWKEMSESGLSYMIQQLNKNKDDPVAAAAVFHGMTPNIEREGSSINKTFAAAGAKRGYESSGDSSNAVIKNRGGAASAYYKKFKGTIQDGTEVSGVSDTGDSEGTGTDDDSTTTSCDSDTASSTSSSLGVGDGKFTDKGEVKGLQNVLANSTATDRLFGSKLEGDGNCAAIVSRVWRGQDIGYGVNYANKLWTQNASNGIGHADRSPKKGAILIYNSSSGNPAGHVVIYLGDNKVLNDGKIRDANFVEGGGWHEKYLGWIDPNDLNWDPKLATDDYLKNTLSRY